MVGSINSDLSVVVPNLPTPGTTVLGTRLSETDGGKGGNQAVAIARLGGHVTMVGRVGADERGRHLLAALNQEGLDTQLVGIDEDEPTGAALILVDEQGENVIAVAAGANAALSAEQAAAAVESASADLLLAQLEIPLSAVIAAARTAKIRGITVVLNAAPATPLPTELLSLLDVLVANREEAAVALAADLPDRQAVLVAAALHSEQGPPIVITLGADGVVAAERGHAWHRPADDVVAIDTVGAGDTFTGALALLLAEGHELADAVDIAASAGALAVCRRGARAGIPSRADLERFRRDRSAIAVEVANAP